VRRDPPEAIAISASGREVFPVAEDGVALGPCIMAGDTRGEEIAGSTRERFTAEDWFGMCGHLPGRMDPINRMIWWQNRDPEITERARYMVGWHEFLTLRLAGRAVTDKSLASHWLAYDFSAGKWSSERLRDYDINPELLPEIRSWGEVIGELRPDLARRFALAKRPVIAVGGFDAICATLGSGVSGVGTAALLCGSWEDIVAPSAPPSVITLAELGLPLLPYPGETKAALFAASPNGTSVLNWALSLTGTPLKKIEAKLVNSGLEPSPVLAVTRLSRMDAPSGADRLIGGALIGLTLSCSGFDIIKACLEGVALDTAAQLRQLRGLGVPVEVLRAVGGGSRSPWWMQLKADLSGVPIEITNRPEPGAFGAALLAGLALGLYPSAEQAAAGSADVIRQFEPDRRRQMLFRERRQEHGAALQGTLGRRREITLSPNGGGTHD
jgi:xylulokinase